MCDPAFLHLVCTECEVVHLTWPKTAAAPDQDEVPEGLWCFACGVPGRLDWTILVFPEKSPEGLKETHSNSQWVKCGKSPSLV